MSSRCDLGSDKAIRARIPARGRVYLWDVKQPGLGLRLSHDGKGRFFAVYRIGGKQRRADVGEWPATRATTPRPRAGERPVPGAREVAAEIRRRARIEGHDPLAERARATGEATVAQLLDLWLADHVAKKRPATIAQYSRIANDLRKRWGRRPVDEIEREDVARLRTALGATPYSANRALAVVSILFAWAIEAGLRSSGRGNPAQGIKRYQEKQREAYLSDAQVRDLDDAIGEHVEDPIMAAALRFVLFSGWRRDEVLRLKWENVDLERGIATFESKSGPTSRPLTAQAREILEALPRIGAAGWCFPSPRTGGPIRGIHRLWDDVRKSVGLPDLRLHDLRHNVGTALTSEGVPLPLVARALGHRSLASTARYAHATDEASQAAVEKLSARFAKARAAKPAKVLRHRPRGSK